MHEDHIMSLDNVGQSTATFGGKVGAERILSLESKMRGDMAYMPTNSLMD